MPIIKDYTSSYSENRIHVPKCVITNIKSSLVQLLVSQKYDITHGMA